MQPSRKYLPWGRTMSEPFEVRKIAYRHNCGDIGFMYNVEVYYPARLHSAHYEVLGRDEMDVYNQIRERHNNVRCSED